MLTGKILAESKKMEKIMSLINIIKDGGFIMYPLVLFSLANWAVIFEKIWGLFQFKKQFNEVHTKALELFKAKKWEEARGLFAQVNPLIAGPHLALLEGRENKSEDDKEKREEKIQRRLSETQLGLRRFLWVLGTIGSSAPFIGLFGTVVGIIGAFKDMASTGKGGFSVVAHSLSEALVATAAGIVVAVIAVVSFNYFQNYLSTLMIEFKNKLQDLNDYVD